MTGHPPPLSPTKSVRAEMIEAAERMMARSGWDTPRVLAAAVVDAVMLQTAPAAPKHRNHWCEDCQEEIDHE